MPASHSPEARATQRAAFASLKRELAERRSTLPSREGLLPCELPTFDRALGGGLPAGLVTLEGARSSGRGALAARALAVASRSGFVAVLDEGSLYPPALARAGVLLDRLLILPIRDTRALGRALDTLLRSRVCRVVLVRAQAWSAPLWARFARLARETGSTLLALLDGALRVPAGVAALRLRCRSEGLLLCGRGSVGVAFLGYTFYVEAFARTLPDVVPILLRAANGGAASPPRERRLRTAGLSRTSSARAG